MPSPLRLGLGTTLAASILVVAPLAVRADTLYSNDFSGGIAGSVISGGAAAWAYTFTDPVGAFGSGGAGAPNEWVSATLGTDVTPTGNNAFLGREESFANQTGDTYWVNGSVGSQKSGANYANLGLGNDMVRLGITGLSGAATKITVSFDLLIIHSWNGNGGKFGEDGPNETADFFTFGYSTAANGTTIGTIGNGASFTRGFDATFANHNASSSQPAANRQSFGGTGNGAPILGSTNRNAPVNQTYANETGATVANTDTTDLTPNNPLGYADRYGATMYHVVYDISDSDMLSSAALYFFFGGSNLESFLTNQSNLNSWFSTAIGEESWGIDNLNIARVSAVPLPAPIVLLLSAIATGAGFVRRRKV